MSLVAVKYSRINRNYFVMFYRLCGIICKTSFWSSTNILSHWSLAVIRELECLWNLQLAIFSRTFPTLRNLINCSHKLSLGKVAIDLFRQTSDPSFFWIISCNSLGCNTIMPVFCITAHKFWMVQEESEKRQSLKWWISLLNSDSSWYIFL